MTKMKIQIKITVNLSNDTQESDQYFTNHGRYGQNMADVDSDITAPSPSVFLSYWHSYVVIFL